MNCNEHTPNPANPGISRLTCERSTTSLAEGVESEAASIWSGEAASESDSSLASGQSSSAGMPGFRPDDISFTHGFRGSSCKDANSALRVSSWQQQTSSQYNTIQKCVQEFIIKTAKLHYQTLLKEARQKFGSKGGILIKIQNIIRT